MKQLVIAATAGLLLNGAAAASDIDARRSPVVEVVDKTKDSVVNISARTLVERSNLYELPYGDLFHEFFRRQFGHQRTQTPERSLGTGFMVGSEGHVLTNYHVVSRAETVFITMANGDRFTAELVGAAPDADLALLLVDNDGESLPPGLEFFVGDPYIGETVIAIGNPFGLDHSVTVGVISARDRTLRAGSRTYAGVLQTDASINPGNSGGPLLNVLGKVVGVNTAIFQGAQGIGFAIPADTTSRILDELASIGSLRPGWTGLDVQDLTTALAAGMGLRSTDGILVTTIVPGSPAEQAGLDVGDLLTHVDGHRLRRLSDFAAHMGTFPVGGRMTISGERNGQERSWTVNVASYQKERINGWFDRFGLAINENEKSLVVRGTRSGTRAAEIGFRAGDVIVSIDRIPTSDRFRLQEHLLRHRQKSYFLFGVLRGRHLQRVSLKLPPPDSTY